MHASISRADEQNCGLEISTIKLEKIANTYNFEYLRWRQPALASLRLSQPAFCSVELCYSSHPFRLLCTLAQGTRISSKNSLSKTFYCLEIPPVVENKPCCGFFQGFSAVIMRNLYVFEVVLLFQDWRHKKMAAAIKRLESRQSHWEPARIQRSYRRGAVGTSCKTHIVVTNTYI